MTFSVCGISFPVTQMSSIVTFSQSSTRWKLRMSASSCRSVRLSVWNNSTATERIFMKYPFEDSLKFSKSLNFRSSRTAVTDNLYEHPHRPTTDFHEISLWGLIKIFERTEFPFKSDSSNGYEHRHRPTIVAGMVGVSTATGLNRLLAIGSASGD